MEWDKKMLDQLLSAIERNYIDENTIGKFFYWHLESVLNVAEQMEGGREMFLALKKCFEDINIQRLRKQEKIIVGFIANYASSWVGDELYRLFEKSERFEPYVYLISNHNGQSMDMIKSEYSQNLQFFKQRNLRVLQTLNLDTGEQYSWEEIGVKPQVCIWLTSWVDLFKDQFYLLNYSLDTLHVYIPYGIMAAENEKNTFVYDQYNKIIHNVVWKNFEESSFAVEMAAKYAFVGKDNAVYTGCPKMDSFYYKPSEGGSIWDGVKEKAGNKAAKGIIYAPHHTIEDDEPVNFSTFAANYEFMLELAEKYQDETVWIFKPHPHLKYKAIRSGLFNDENEWNAYENRWRNLKNGGVMLEGSYSELFRESAAMIGDSISFLSEYLYVNKPLLFLQRKEQAFNDFGKQLMKVHYKAGGDDGRAIEDFLVQVVLGGNDSKKECRKKFFRENLDYMDMTGKSAAENIYEQFVMGLC